MVFLSNWNTKWCHLLFKVNVENQFYCLLLILIDKHKIINTRSYWKCENCWGSGLLYNMNQIGPLSRNHIIMMVMKWNVKLKNLKRWIEHSSQPVKRIYKKELISLNSFKINRYYLWLTCLKILTLLLFIPTLIFDETGSYPVFIECSK